jgi:hypothetical protein
MVFTIWFDSNEYDETSVNVDSLDTTIAAFVEIATGTGTRAKVFRYMDNAGTRTSETRTHREKACAPGNLLSSYIQRPDGVSIIGTRESPFFYVETLPDGEYT